MARLPVEIRLKIFEYAFGEEKTVVVRPGYIPAAIRRSRLPVAEVMEGWVQNKVWRMEDTKAFRMFKRMTKTYGLGRFVTAVSAVACH